MPAHIHMCNLWLYVCINVRAKSILRGVCYVCVAPFQACDVQLHFFEENGQKMLFFALKNVLEHSILFKNILSCFKMTYSVSGDPKNVTTLN